jgi:hypothetical protein
VVGHLVMTTTEDKNAHEKEENPPCESKVSFKE